MILDIMMPGMSGLRVCEELRKLSTVPILFLTAKSQESDKLLGLTAGGDDYLPKPFSFAELSAVSGQTLLQGQKKGIPANEDAFLKTVFCPKAPAPAQRLTLQTGRRRRLHRCRAAARPASGRACP